MSSNSSKHESPIPHHEFAIYGCLYGKMCTHPLMKLCDEPQLRLQVGSVLLRSDVTQEVFMSHPRSQEYVPLVLP